MSTSLETALRAVENMDWADKQAHEIKYAYGETSALEWEIAIALRRVRYEALVEATSAVELLHREHQGPERGLALDEAYNAVRALISDKEEDGK